MRLQNFIYVILQLKFRFLLIYAGVAELADAPALGAGAFGVQVQVLSPAPHRRGLCIVRDDFSFEKSSAHSRRRLPSCGSRLLFGGLTLTEDRRPLRQPFSPCIRRRRRSKILPLSAKSHTRYDCSLVKALTEPSRRYQLFAGSALSQNFAVASFLLHLYSVTPDPIRFGFSVIFYPCGFIASGIIFATY